MSYPIIVFKPTVVFVEMNLFHPDGRPLHIPDEAGDDLMNLPFMDNYGNGFGASPAEVMFSFPHPRDVTPANLISMQAEVIAIIAEHERREEAKRAFDQAEFVTHQPE